MWKVIYIAPSKTWAERLRNVLQLEGLLVDLRVTNPASIKGAVEILVLESEAEEAHEIINRELATLKD